MTLRTVLRSTRLKRLVDIGGAASALVCLSPVALTAAVAVRLSMGSPVLFRQRRGGLGGGTFELLKFRTMRHPRDGEELFASDADRITRVGQLLRSTSIDELPSLVNVLRGDMSLVGPRPLVARYLDRYTSEQARRHEVKPGITGLAQVRGRNSLTWEEKFAHDVEYVDRWDLLLDMRILIETVWKVLAREAVAYEGPATMEFTGSASEKAP